MPLTPTATTFQSDPTREHLSRSSGPRSAAGLSDLHPLRGAPSLARSSSKETLTFWSILPVANYSSDLSYRKSFFSLQKALDSNTKFR